MSVCLLLGYVCLLCIKERTEVPAALYLTGMRGIVGIRVSWRVSEHKDVGAGSQAASEPRTGVLFCVLVYGNKESILAGSASMEMKELVAKLLRSCRLVSFLWSCSMESFPQRWEHAHVFPLTAGHDPPLLE
eukprot:1160532-Pelagomonas_calceolata.AAC.5